MNDDGRASGQPGPKGKGMSPRVKMIVSGALTVGVLAVVIFVLWSATSPKRPQTPTTTIELSPAQRSNADYQQGLASLESSDTTQAIALFQRALTADPTNSSAKSQLDAIAAQKAKDPQTSAVATKTVAPVDPFSKPVKHLSSLLPGTGSGSLSGYTLGPTQTQGSDSTRAGNPKDPASLVTRALWTVHDRESSSNAIKWQNEISKSLYSKSADSVTVNGVTGYFGTDGARFATVSFVRGRYVFEVVLTSSTGAPADLKALATQAAEAFPTAF